MQTEILKYVEGCDKCQRSNTHCRKSFSLLNPNEIPIRPWQIISRRTPQKSGLPCHLCNCQSLFKTNPHDPNQHFINGRGLFPDLQRPSLSTPQNSTECLK